MISRRNGYNETAPTVIETLSGKYRADNHASTENRSKHPGIAWISAAEDEQVQVAGVGGLVFAINVHFVPVTNRMKMCGPGVRKIYWHCGVSRRNGGKRKQKPTVRNGREII